MPTIYRQNGFEVMIYTNDHRPAHVKTKRRALIIVGEHDVAFWMEWRRIHG